MTLQTLKIRYTRPDRSTVPGGIIMRYRKSEDGREEWIVHNFERNHGQTKPIAYFWGSYCDTLERANRAFAEKVGRAKQVERGGSLIPDDELQKELAKEIVDYEERMRERDNGEVSVAR